MTMTLQNQLEFCEDHLRFYKFTKRELLYRCAYLDVQISKGEEHRKDLLERIEKENLIEPGASPINEKIKGEQKE